MCCFCKSSVNLKFFRKLEALKNEMDDTVDKGRAARGVQAGEEQPRCWLAHNGAARTSSRWSISLGGGVWGDACRKGIKI